MSARPRGLGALLPARARPFAVHAAALAWIGGLSLVCLAREPGPGELRARLASPRPEQRMQALHALSQRDPVALDAAALAALRADPDERVRELVFTNVVTRHTGKPALAEGLAGIADPGERWRASFWLQRDVASRRWITRADLATYFETLERRPRTP